MSVFTASLIVFFVVLALYLMKRRARLRRED
jgi:hypothetical protein